MTRFRPSLASVLFLLATALAAGSLLWFLGPPPSRPAVPEDTGGDASAPAGASAASLRGSAPPGASGGAATHPSSLASTAIALDVRDLPRGDLVVIPVDENDAPLVAADLRVDLAWESPKLARAALGVPGAEAASWTFSDVPIGTVRVHVAGPWVRETYVTAQITAKPQDALRVRVQPAGALAYRVATHSGAPLEFVTLSLQTLERQPVSATWQEREVAEQGVRYLRRLGSRRRASTIRIGPEGVAASIPPGDYHFRVETPDGGFREDVVRIQARHTLEHVVTFR